MLAYCRNAVGGVRLGIGLLACALVQPVCAAVDGPVNFDREIRPILSDNCFQCHGPDQAQRQAELRLDVESSAKRLRDGVRPIVEGKPEESALWQRITAADPQERMPPTDSGKALSPAQIELVGRWIRQGANWQRHWALEAPRRPELPVVKDRAWPINAIDAFVLARLEAEGLAPSPEADAATLARRTSLDLTGLPPSPEETERFVADRSPDAYERFVDRLLASPRYGERLAARWLDAARYADTSGYQTDGARSMWRWRDGVIEAFNRNQPFDQFTIEQLAGDMLRGATLEQRIASGFNRNHRGNSEGGIIPEEYAVEYVVDRVDTTATVWLGLTMTCARCHDHKFDPITQREYYRMFAFFNNVPEKGRAIKVGNSPPFIKAPTRDQQDQLAALEARLQAAQAELAGLNEAIESGLAAWSASAATADEIDWAPDGNLLASYALDEPATSEPNRPAIQVEGAASFEPGAIRGAVRLDGQSAVNVGDVANFGYFDKFTLTAWIRPRRDSGTILARMTNSSDADGYSVQLACGRLQVNLVKRWLDDALRVEAIEPLALDRWQHVAVTYDGSRVAGGVRVFVDGQPREIRVLLDELNQSFNSSEPLRIGGGGPGPRFDGAIDEVRIYKSNLALQDLLVLSVKESIHELLNVPASERSPAQAAKLRACYLERHAP